MAGEDDLSLESIGDIFEDTTTEVAPEPEPKATEPEPASSDPQPAPQREDMIPSWRLREEADRARRAEASMAELQRRLDTLEKANPPKSPEIWEDPRGFVDQGVKSQLDPVTQQLGQMREQFSQMMAVQRFGAEKVQAAYQAMDQAMRGGDQQARGVYERMMNGSMDPYGEMVSWHQRSQVLSSVGNDLDAYKAKIRAEEREAALADPEFRAKAYEAHLAQARGNPVIRPAQRPAPRTQTIPSVNRATTSSDDDDEASMSIGDVFRSASGGR
jgi:hypothetical protein